MTKKKLEQMKLFIDYFKNRYPDNSQPFSFYIDARWSSFELMNYLAEQGFYAVLSCSSKIRPQKLMRSIRTGLEVGEWNIV